MNNLRYIDIERNKGFYTALGYRSATVTSREMGAAVAASGSEHIEYSREKLINQSRQFKRDNAIYSGMIERAVAYIIGNGFELQMKSNSADYNKKVEALWKNYHKRPEIKQILTGNQHDCMIGRELLIAGDTLEIKAKGGFVQHIESEQLISKKFKDGIEKDAFGKPIKFWISTYNNFGRIVSGNAKAYDPNDILFITDPDRPSSVRSVPPCQSAFPMLHRINDVCDSEAIAWQLLARLAVSVSREAGDELAVGESKEDTERNNTDTEGQLTTRMTELDYALIFHGKPGEEVKGIEHNIPGKNFSESLRMFLRLLGLPLGLPLEFILLDWTQSNYSQSRAVLEQAYTRFLSLQEIIETSHYRPLLEWKIEQWVKDGLITKRTKDGLEHEWIAPTFPWIDQLKEVQAYGEKVERGFATQSEVCKSLKRDRTEVVDGREREIRDAIKRVQGIKNDTGTDVPWEILAGLTRQGAKAAGQDETEENTKDEEKKIKD